LGDLLTLSVMASDGNRYLRVEDTLPIGSSGLRFGMNASGLTYRLTSPEYSSLGSEGTSKTIGFSMAYPIIRSRKENLNASINFDNKYYLNQTSGAITSDFVIHSASFGLNGNLFDDYFDGGANNASLTWTVGDVDLSGSANQSSDATTANTQGHYTKSRYSVSRQQKLSEDWSLFASYNAQWTRRNLDSSEGFYLGGFTGVRAYPTNEGRGSQGQMLNLELRAQLVEGFNWLGFYDWGRVVVNADKNFSGSSSLNSYELRGYGMTVSWQTDKGLTLKATWSKRVGANPNPSSTGSDQDGTLKLNRFWFSASLAF